MLNHHSHWDKVPSLPTKPDTLSDWAQAVDNSGLSGVPSCHLLFGNMTDETWEILINTKVSEQKIQITILILKRGPCLQRTPGLSSALWSPARPTCLHFRYWSRCHAVATTTYLFFSLRLQLRIFFLSSPTTMDLFFLSGYYVYGNKGGCWFPRGWKWVFWVDGWID